jgi:hypothetical protein
MIVIEEALLQELYVGKNLSQRDVATKMGISRGQVRCYLERHGIAKPRDMVLLNMKGSLFERGSGVNVGRKRPDLVGNKWNVGRFSELHHNWMGDDVGYAGKHSWLHSRYGRANHCALNACHKSSRYHWANISGRYSRAVRDFIQLCPSCHRKFDTGRIRRPEVVACRKKESYILDARYVNHRKNCLGRGEI